MPQKSDNKIPSGRADNNNPGYYVVPEQRPAEPATNEAKPSGGCGVLCWGLSLCGLALTTSILLSGNIVNIMSSGTLWLLQPQLNSILSFIHQNAFVLGLFSVLGLAGMIIVLIRSNSADTSSDDPGTVGVLSLVTGSICATPSVAALAILVINLCAVLLVVALMLAALGVALWALCSSH
jgi:hypothetical protein